MKEKVADLESTTFSVAVSVLKVADSGTATFLVADFQ
jgi:hypothetical protein